ncbi:hypothetical protein L6164_011107 [Bauhinia variegata]|uniref:Uncharacterized protein n=1 Tax=Bauhinia variegata TaxID=167791 RepID=A0ACB9P4S2_BAUVA|nr:hypothetical protein L6164_011107 [Bauhinia variegata]
MEDSEKLTALKKAYADIILNTAKEAAARIMMSERKAMMFQRELVSTKEEALRMLLRLKQMLDSKVSEAEMTSLSQQKKIDVLEAQLQEAEEIVRDLRAELREGQDELEKLKSSQMHPPIEQSIDGQIAAQHKILREKRFDPYGPFHSHSVADSKFESVCDTRNSSANQTNESSKCHVSCDHINKCCIHNPDFASIVIRRKEPELYRNGCTQRIRASERSFFDGNVSLSENVDDAQNETLVGEAKGMSTAANTKTDSTCEAKSPGELKSLQALEMSVRRKKRRVKRGRKSKALPSRLQSEMLVRVDEEGKGMSITTNTKTDHICVAENSHELKPLQPLKVPVGRKKKIVRRCNKSKSHLSGVHSDQVKEMNKASNVSCDESSHVLDSNDPSASNVSCDESSHVLNNNDPSRQNSSEECRNEDQKNQMSPPSEKVPSDTTAIIEPPEILNDTEKEEAFLKAFRAWNKIDDDKELLDKSHLTRQESLEVPTCRENVETASGSPDKQDLKISDLDEKVSCQSVNDRFLKYTFRRKRKRELLSGPDVDSSVEKGGLKKTCGEKQNGHVEPQKSCTTTESSRDSRRLAQVARQLISLSEKKWWQ